MQLNEFIKSIKSTFLPLCTCTNFAYNNCYDSRYICDLLFFHALLYTDHAYLLPNIQDTIPHYCSGCSQNPYPCYVLI